MNPVPWLQMTNMISYQGLVRTFQEALASLEGEITQVQTIGTHLVYLVAIKNIILSQEGHGLIYFKRRFHPVLIEQEITV